MSSNQLLPVFVASGIAVLGCAAAFYFSDSDTQPKRRKTYPIHTKNFDDEDDLESYDGDYPELKSQRKLRRKIQDQDEDEDDEEEEEESESEEEEEEKDDDDDEDEDDEDDEDDRVKYLVSKKQPKNKSKKGSRRA